MATSSQVSKQTDVSSQENGVMTASENAQLRAIVVEGEANEEGPDAIVNNVQINSNQGIMRDPRHIREFPRNETSRSLLPMHGNGIVQ